MYSFIINRVNYNNFLYFSFFVSLISVASSYIFEYYVNLIPCKICLYQRYLWILLLLITFLYLFILKRFTIIKIFILLSITMLILGIGLYHSMLEIGLIKNIFSCSQGTTLNFETVEDLDKHIRNARNTDCSISKYYIFGLTLANISILLSSLLLFFNLIVIKKKIT